MYLFQIKSSMVGKLFIYVFCLLLFGSYCNFMTQKRVWMYWSGNFEEAPDFYKICEYKMRKTCQKQGWDYTLLTNDNLHLHLNNFTAFQEVVSKRKLMYPQNLADYVKLLIIHDNGGVFFDITSINFEGLNWLLDLEKDPKKLTNYRKGVEPEVILFYNTFQQSSSEYFDEQEGFKNFLPGYQVFFLAGKRNSKTIKMFIDQFEKMYIKTFEQNVQMIYLNDILYRNLDYNYYLTTQKSISFAVQKFQQQLDNNLTLLEKRKNANEQLKIWAIHCQDSVVYNFYFFQDIKFNYALTIKQLEDLQGFRPKFYIKYMQGGSGFYEILTKVKQFFKKYENFEKFLESNPTKQDCSSSNFIIEGSVLGILISENQIAQNQKIRAISVEQRTKWQNYCKGINAYKQKTRSILQEYISKPLGIFEDQSHISRMHQHLGDVGLLQSAQDFFLQNRFYLIYFGFYYLGFFFGIGLVVAIKKLILLLLDKFLGFNSPENETVQCSLKKKIFVLSFSPLPPLLYLLVSQFGRYHNQVSILIVYTMYLLMRKYVFQQKLYEKIFGLSLSQFDRILSPATHYFIIKSTLHSIQNRDEIIIPFAILFSFVFPQILKTAESIVLLHQMQVNTLLRFVAKHSQKIISVFTMNLIVLFIFLPNVKFVKINGVYATKYISYCALGYIGLLVILVCSSAIKIGATCLKQLRNKKWTIKQRQLVILMEVVVQLFFIYKVVSYHNNFISWIGNIEKAILQIFLIFLFMPVNLRFCESSRYGNSSYKRIQNNNDNDFQYSIAIENERNLLVKNDEALSVSQKLNPYWTSFLNRSSASTFFLCNLLPFLIFVFGWTYKENQYKQPQYFIIDLLIVFLNSAAILASSQIQGNTNENQVLMEEQNNEKV